MAYQYVDPRTEGYQRVRFTKAQHRRLFPGRKRSWVDRFEYYIKEDRFLMQRFMSRPAVALALLLLPISGLIHGFGKRDFWREHADLLRQKKSGSFSQDQGYPGQLGWDQIAEEAKKCGVFLGGKP